MAARAMRAHRRRRALLFRVADALVDVGRLILAVSWRELHQRGHPLLFGCCPEGFSRLVRISKRASSSLRPAAYATVTQEQHSLDKTGTVMDRRSSRGEGNTASSAMRRVQDTIAPIARCGTAYKELH
jgi:hypothetical protein